MKVTKSQLKELIRHTIVDLTEKTFGSKAQYDAYRKKHNLKPGSKHKVDGKTVTVRDTKKMSKKAKSLGDKMADKLNKRMADLEKKRKQGKKDDKPMDATPAPKGKSKGAMKNPFSKESPAYEPKQKQIDKKNTMQQPFFKISYTDSEGREKTDSMRAKTPAEAKKDFINMNKGRGFKVVKVQKESIKESKKRRYTVKEVRMWMKKLEENRYKKVYNSDARRVAWMVNNEGGTLDEMPMSMKKKWSKAQYGRERYLATEFLKSKSEQLSEGSLKKAMQQWKYIEKGLKPKQKKLVQKALKRLKPKMDKNFKNKDYQDYIDGELDIKVPLPDLMFGKGKEFGQLLSAYSNAIKEPAFYEGKLNETKFIAFYKSKKVTINAKSLYDAKKQIIDKLKVPKKDYGIVSVLNKTEYDKQQFRFEQKLRKSIREIIKEQMNEAYRSQSIFFDKKDKSKLQKLLKKNKGKFPFNPPGESVVNWSLNDRGSKGLEWGGIPKSKYNKAVEFFMKNKLNPRG